MPTGDKKKHMQEVKLTQHFIHFPKLNREDWSGLFECRVKKFFCEINWLPVELRHEPGGGGGGSELSEDPAVASKIQSFQAGLAGYELVNQLPAVATHSLSWSNHVKLGGGLNWSIKLPAVSKPSLSCFFQQITITGSIDSLAPYSESSVTTIEAHKIST